MEKNSKIYVAGHTGLLGSAVYRQLIKNGFTNVIVRTSDVLDLTIQDQVYKFFFDEEPEYVFLCAAHVGGILDNQKYPARYFSNNIQIQTNVIWAAQWSGTKKLLFVGSSCIYPRDAVCPLTEDQLFSGPLEPTNEAYAMAKLAGVKMCQYYRQELGSDFITALPTNLYGPNDNYDLESSHFLPAVIRKLHELKQEQGNLLELWGDGTPRREFMYSDDCADALIFLMQHYSQTEPINVGTGIDETIENLAFIAARVIGVGMDIKYDRSKPNGTHRKVLDVSRLKQMGWTPKYSLIDGLTKTYKDFVSSGWQP